MGNFSLNLSSNSLMKNHLVVTLFALIFCFLSCQSKKDSIKQVNNQDIDLDVNFETVQKNYIHQFPDSSLLKEELIQFYRTANRYPEAIAYADSLANNDNLFPKWFSILATLHFENDDTLKAIANFEKAIAVSPRTSDLLSLGALYAGNKNINALGIANMLEKLEQSRFQKEANYLRGTYYENLGDYANAVKFFNKSIDTDFGFVEAYREKTICLIQIDKTEEALQTIQKAITLNNGFAEGYYWEGVCYEKLKNKNDALESFNMALMYDSSLIEAKDAILQIQQQ
jgi:tetratricopeptide (TPR) repeat protein